MIDLFCEIFFSILDDFFSYCTALKSIIECISSFYTNNVVIFLKSRLQNTKTKHYKQKNVPMLTKKNARNMTQTQL